MTEVSPATRDALVDAIQSGPPPDIIHYYGHGRYKNDQGALLLDGPEGTSSWTSVDRLVTLFSGARLVVLHACQGAMVNDSADEHSLLTSIAPALSAAGVPLVVGMQLTVRMRTAIRVTTVMYRALVLGQSLQTAVNQARQALYIEEEDQASWYVPALYIRSRDIGPAYLMDTHPQIKPSIAGTAQTIVARKKSSVRNVDQTGSPGAQQDIRAEEDSSVERVKQRATGPSNQTIHAEDESEVTDTTQGDM